MSLYNELKRRNVIRVAIAYLVVSWLLVEVAKVVFPELGIPESGIRVLMIVCLIGFLPALVLSWVYELTPDGLVRDTPVARSSVKRLDIIAACLVVAALAFVIVDKVWFSEEQEPSAAQFTSQDTQNQGPGSALQQYPPNSIAVLPFVNMSEDAGNEYFSDGVSEELLNLLAQVHELRVISRSSAFSFKGKDFDIPTVAEKLNVAHVLEGSVRKSGNQVRITAQLIDTRSDSHLWSATYDRTLDNIFEIQDEIAVMVVEQLKVTLLDDAPRSEQVSTDAYTLFLQARYVGRQYSADGFERSNAFYERALAIDPDYAAAWSGLATNYTNQAANGLLSTEEGISLAREAAANALASNPDYAPAHANLGWISYGYDNDVTQAAKHFERALELDPANTYIIRVAATLLNGLNRLDEAISLGEYFTARDPAVASGFTNLGSSYLRAGRWDEAIASNRTALQLSPDYLGAHYRIGMALLFKGEAGAALEAFTRETDEEYQVKGQAVALFALGKEQEFQARLTELIERWGDEWPSEVAHVFAYTGNADGAFQWLEKAIQQREEGMIEQIMHPLYWGIHEDPRWLSTLESIGVSPAQLAAVEFKVSVPD
jgi:TolB-like protein/lipoprotein NlpI